MFYIDASTRLKDFLKQCEDDAQFDRSFFDLVKQQELATRTVRTWHERMVEYSAEWDNAREEMFKSFVGCQVRLHVTAFFMLFLCHALNLGFYCRYLPYLR